MKRIGIVGGSGVGKTTALGALSDLGAELIDCDAVYHELLKTSEPLRKEIANRFGGVFHDTELDRQALGQVVFGDPAALSDLNGITFRYIVEEVRRRMAIAEAADCAVVGIDAAALLETPLKKECDVLVAVTAPASVRVRRLMARDGINEQYAAKRIAAQPNEEYYRRSCDYVLVNDSTAEAFREKARALFASLLALETQLERK